LEHGSYVKQIDFGRFVCKKFVPHLYGSYSACGCGANALALLTGNPSENFGARREDWTSKIMRVYLRKHNFIFEKLTKCAVTNTRFWNHAAIGHQHVVLMSIKLMQNEASWVVVYQERMYHNFEITKMKPYELLNHPIMEALIIKHPSWDEPVLPRRPVLWPSGPGMPKLYGEP